MRNPEVRELSGVLIKAISDPVKATKPALEQLRDTVFVHVVDVSSLALILPVITRGMKERTGESKKHAARILGNLASLVANPRDLAPYMSTLLPEVKNLLVDPLPEVRGCVHQSVGSFWAMFASALTAYRLCSAPVPCSNQTPRERVVRDIPA